MQRTGSNIWKLLLTIFILLNLSIVYTTITHGKKWYYRLFDIMKESFTQVAKIHSAAGISMAIFNIVYLIGSVLVCTTYFVYPRRISKCIDGDSDDCSPPHTSSYYKDEVTTVIVKWVVIFIAIVTELLVAILISRKAIMANRHDKCLTICQIILLWNMFLFVQIWVGLVLLPVCIFLIIAPLQTIPILCAAIALPLLLMLFIAIMLQLIDQLQIRNWDCKMNAVVCIHSSRHMILVVLIVALTALYFNLSPGGTTLSSTEGIIFSFLPSILLSITAWGIKRKLFNIKKTRAERSVRSVSTDLQGTEENAVLDDVDEEPSSHLAEESEAQTDISSIV